MFSQICRKVRVSGHYLCGFLFKNRIPVRSDLHARAPSGPRIMSTTSTRSSCDRDRGTGDSSTSDTITQPREGRIPEEELESALTKTILKLEEIDKNLYSNQTDRGTHLWKPHGGRGVFGGQVVGQALVAAGMTKPKELHVHSMHCYFVKTGDPNRPILYHVEQTRDGRSFSVRTVEAKQNGEAILTLQVSYHKREDSLIEYQYVMPQVPQPEEVKSTNEVLQEYLDASGDELTEAQRSWIHRQLNSQIPLDVKPLDPYGHFRTGDAGKDPKLLYWVKAKGHIGEDQNLHRCVAAYLSDMTLLRTALVPFPSFRPTMMASLDHAMWFHTHFRTDEWMLYECESPRSVGARAFTLGRLWKRDGVLAVSVAQEGVVRGKHKGSSKL